MQKQKYCCLLSKESTIALTIPPHACNFYLQLFIKNLMLSIKFKSLGFYAFLLRKNIFLCLQFKKLTKYLFYLQYAYFNFGQNRLIQTKRDSVTIKVFKLRLWGARLGSNTMDVSDPNFIVLRCPFYLLCILYFKDGTHRSKP